MNRRLSLHTPSRACRLALDNSGTTIAARIPRITITIMISISVKPARRRRTGCSVTGNIMHLSLLSQSLRGNPNLLNDGRLAVGVGAPDPAGARATLEVVDEPHYRRRRRPVHRGRHVALGAVGGAQRVLGDALHVRSLVERGGPGGVGRAGGVGEHRQLVPEHRLVEGGAAADQRRGAR